MHPLDQQVISILNSRHGQNFSDEDSAREYLESQEGKRSIMRDQQLKQAVSKVMIAASQSGVTGKKW